MEWYKTFFTDNAKLYALELEAPEMKQWRMQQSKFIKNYIIKRV
jgi:hypothetical protein